MTRQQALKDAAEATHRLALMIPEPHRPNLAISWGVLTDEIEDLSDRQAIERVADWRAAMEERLSNALTHTPLERSRQ